MGAFRSSIPRLLWLYLVGACFLFLIPNTNFQVHAENDADLVFENNLEESKISPDKSHTIERRDTSHETNELNSKSSHPEEEDHWLTTAVKRIKRQFDLRSWFASEDDSREKRASGEQGQGQRGQQTDDDEYNDLDDDDDDEIVEHLVPQSQKDPDISGIFRPGQQQTDDEDDFGDISGEGSGIIGRPPIIPGQPIYYRITMTVFEPFVEAFHDRNSREYRELAEKLVRAVDELYEQLEGRQSATVIKIEKREADIFSSKVTMDLGTVNNYDHGRIRNHLYSHIRNYHTLGPYRVSDDEFTFREFEGSSRPLPTCQSDELPCHSGGCVPSSARCNGIVECEDESDERGCDFNINEVDLRPDLPNLESDGGFYGLGGTHDGHRPRPHAETTTSSNIFSTIFGNVFNENAPPEQPPYHPRPPYEPVETTTRNMFVTLFDNIYNQTHGLEEEPDVGTTESRPWYPEQPPYRPPEQPPYRPPEQPTYRQPEQPPFIPPERPLPPYRPPYEPVETTTRNMFVTLFDSIYNQTHGLEEEPEEGTTESRPWYPEQPPYRPPEQPPYRQPEQPPFIPPERPLPPYRPPYEPVETTTRNMFVTLFDTIYNNTHGLEEEPDEVTTESRPWYTPEQPQPPYRPPYEEVTTERWPWFLTSRPEPGSQETDRPRPPPYIPPYEPVETTTKNMFVTLFGEIYNMSHGLDVPEETTVSQPWYPQVPPEQPYRPPQEPFETTTRNMFETIFGGIFNGDTTPTYPQSSHPTINRCRADDVVRCADGITYICADQQCDGNPDCPYGDDERNCACAEGELSCDISRCIPLSKRCDGVDDCEDKTDEFECA